MGLLDRLFGRRGPEPQERYAPPPSRSAAPGTEDDRAVERYRYLLRTAPPEQIEQAHAEAFAKLTPEQRRQVLHELSTEDPSTPASDDPRSLARSATRAEMRQPGTLERTFGGRGAGGFGGGYGAGGLGMGGASAAPCWPASPARSSGPPSPTPCCPTTWGTTSGATTRPATSRRVTSRGTTTGATETSAETSAGTSVAGTSVGTSTSDPRGPLVR